MQKQVLFYERNGEFLDLFVSGVAESSATGWLRINGGGRSSSAMRIIESKADNGLTRLRVKPVFSFYKSSNWIAPKTVTVIDENYQPEPEETKQDSTTPHASGPFEDNSTTILSAAYVLAAVLVLFFGYKLIFKK